MNVHTESGLKDLSFGCNFSLLTLRKLEKAVAVSGVCLGVPEENSGKAPGNSWKCLAGAPNAVNSRISGTRKGKPAGNLGSTLPGPCPQVPCGAFLKSTVPAFSSFLIYIFRSFLLTIEVPWFAIVLWSSLLAIALWSFFAFNCFVELLCLQLFCGASLLTIRGFLLTTQAVSVASPAEPRGEKMFDFCANLGRWKTFRKVPVKHF